MTFVLLLNTCNYNNHLFKNLNGGFPNIYTIKVVQHAIYIYIYIYLVPRVPEDI